MAPTLATKQAEMRSADRMAADRKFGKYKPEEERATFGLKVEGNETVRGISEAYRDFAATAYGLRNAHVVCEDIDVMRYDLARSKVKDLQYSSGDVEAFSILLDGIMSGEKNRGIAQCMQEFAGYFLSALITCGGGDGYRIRIGHLGFAIPYLGFKNEKVVEIDGDAGEYLGCYMTGGEILVMGSADLPGFSMSGGVIRIRGDCLWANSETMKGGELHIGGSAGRMNPSDGGRVYNRGKLIADKDGTYWPPPHARQY